MSDVLKFRRDNWENAGIDWETGQRWDRIFNEMNSVDPVALAGIFHGAGIDDPHEAYLVLREAGLKFSEDEDGPFLLESIDSQELLASYMSASKNPAVVAVGVMLALADIDHDVLFPG
jgi:hypothetical protein